MPDPMRPAPAAAAPRVGLGREAITMALYVAVVLLAALVALPAEDVTHRAVVAASVWGTAIGLALAHWFAFTVSSRLYAGGRLRRADARLGAVQAMAALAVAAVSTAPLLVVSHEAAVEAAIALLSGIIALAGFITARRAGAGRLRALLAGLATLALGAVCVVVKVALSH